VTSPPPELRADCAQCFGLCCVALPFSRSADFAFDKATGEPCRNLRSDFGCDIHDRLRPAGFAGCTVYDCFGAGQKTAQVTFGGRDWRANPEIAAPMFDAFTIMRQLHELLWYATEALTWKAAGPVHDELRRAAAETERLTDHVLDSPDVAAHRADAVAPLLRRASALMRGAGGVDHAGADLIGADLRAADLRAADLRGAYLIAADLRGADLHLADLLGADLRDADVRGVDLRTAIYLTQPQVNAARGDAATRLRPALTRPAHWASKHA
jgi:uncharacterized protein YjbI with pentapeptide repeats